MASRRGPKKQAGKREMNGRLSRNPVEAQVREVAEIDRAEWDAMATAMMARWRVHGVKMSEVRDQRAGTVIGRMAMAFKADDVASGLSAAQYEAALKFIEDSENYARAVQSPRQPGAVDLNAVRGGSVSGPDHVAFVARAVRRYKEARAAIQDCANHHRGANLFAALYEIVMRDRDFIHMHGDLRIALNALSRHYGLTAGELSAA